MTCAWQELLAVLPMWMQKDVDRLGKKTLRELRLRLQLPPELVFEDKSCWLERIVTRDDLNYTVNAASKYSPWAAGSAAEGYITAKGGHRIGLCGETAVRQGEVTAIRNYHSLCIRVARDYPGLAAGLKGIKDSILILGPPGWGKTTLLRDLVRQISLQETVCVVDERSELFPEGFERGKSTDVLTACPKKKGISMLLRTMGPATIAVDEITDPNDTAALMLAANCGVRLVATAHAASISDLRKRTLYRPLLDSHIFDVILVLNKDQTYTIERMTEWVTDGLVRY